MYASVTRKTVPVLYALALLSKRHGLPSVSVSAQDGIVALGKAHTRLAPSPSILPKVVLETVPSSGWLNSDHCRPRG